MEGISAEAERLFMRILMKADDYGRFHADSRLLKAHCFPLEDTIAANHIGPWLIELEKRGLLVTYTVSDRMFLAIPNYGQRLRTSRAKFPPMPGEGGDWLPMFTEFPRLADNCPQPAADCGNAPPEEKRRRREVEGEEEAEGNPPPPAAEIPGWSGRNKRMATFDQVLKFGQAQIPPVSQECCEAFFDRMESEGWITKEGHPLNDWVPRFRTWVRAWFDNSAKSPTSKAR